MPAITWGRGFGLDSMPRIDSMPRLDDVGPDEPYDQDRDDSDYGLAGWSSGQAPGGSLKSGSVVQAP
jgi:hypothetical protein